MLPPPVLASSIRPSGEKCNFYLTGRGVLRRGDGNGRGDSLAELRF